MALNKTPPTFMKIRVCAEETSLVPEGFQVLDTFNESCQLHSELCYSGSEIRT